MPVQPVGECGRPSKVVWERAAHGGTVLGERHAAGMAACTGARAAGLRFARWGWGPSGVGAGFVLDGLARAAGFLPKMRERARERWLANMK